ncbi:MAG: type II toxin-antitoxin system prevent-host-death family antitoxin [Planctomycetes bacterium]|nr:type II toxin-antitoxin system prevent-host-death family antitoxin [Planctomycetota bacterium]
MSEKSKNPVEHAIRVRVTVRADHTVSLPDEVPAGEAEVIILMPLKGEDEPTHGAEARRRLFASLRGELTIAEDFDDPLPDDVVADFEGRNES